MRAISLISGIFILFFLTFFYQDSFNYNLEGWTFFVSILFLLKLHSIRQSIHVVYGYKNNMDKWVVLAMLLVIVSPYTLALTYPALMYKSKHYSIENMYGQCISFFLPFIDPSSIFHIDGAGKAFVLINAAMMYSAGYEKLRSKMWRSGKAIRGFVSLPHLIKPCFYPRILKISFLCSPILLLEFLFPFSLLTNVTLFLFIFGLCVFSISLFTVFDISYIGQLLLACMICCWFIWSNHFICLFDFSLTNLFVFLLACISMINLFYPTKFISLVMKLTTGSITSIKVFTEIHQTGIFSYKFQKDGKDILMAFDKDGLFHKSQIFASRYKQAAMYKVTDYCLGKKNYSDIADLAYQASNGDTVTLLVKPYESKKGYNYYKNYAWEKITEISFGKTYNLKQLKAPSKIETFRKV